MAIWINDSTIQIKKLIIVTRNLNLLLNAKSFFYFYINEGCRYQKKFSKYKVCETLKHGKRLLLQQEESDGVKMT